MLNIPDRRLALQAYEKILDMILSGRAKPGTLIHERRLAEMLEMSRTPVRDALLMLEGEGLLVRQGAKGLQIKQMRVEDFMEALQIRLLLEPEAARMASGRIAEPQLTALATRLQALISHAGGDRAVDREEVRSVDDTLHGLIADAVGNAQMSTIIRTLRRQTQIFDLKNMPERLQDTCQEHLAIVRSLGDADPARAAETMKLHLGNVRQSIVTRLVKI